MISRHEGGGGLKNLGKSVLNCYKKFGGEGGRHQKSDITLLSLVYDQKAFFLL